MNANVRLHIIGICGVFMGGIALIARELGYQVSGSDHNVYPPMSAQLEQHGIQLMQGYKPENLQCQPDLVIIGNALSRGNTEIEAVLNLGLRYISGPQWLAENVLSDKWVLGVAGTHGKTTTSSILAWILEYQGLAPGFLIGGVPLNFGLSARLGKSNFFVIEADEYDCAFFDKRSKFIHYHPKTAILNNLEFDHADIFADLDAIKKQFHYLVKTIPGNGLIIAPKSEKNLADVLKMGCWADVVTIGTNQDALWQAQLIKADGSEFKVFYRGVKQGVVSWSLIGEHNVYNAMSAIVAAKHIGISVLDSIIALSSFKNVKRHLEVISKTDSVTIYDDFAHHPTAIYTTLDGLRKKVGTEKIIAVVEPSSNTMRMGVHAQTLAQSLKLADLAIIYQPENLSWDITNLQSQAYNIKIETTLLAIIKELKTQSNVTSHVVLMSSGSFAGIYQQLIDEF